MVRRTVPSADTFAVEEIAQSAESIGESSLSRPCFRYCPRTKSSAAGVPGTGDGIPEDRVDAGYRLYGGTPAGEAKGGVACLAPLLHAVPSSRYVGIAAWPKSDMKCKLCRSYTHAHGRYPQRLASRSSRLPTHTQTARAQTGS